MSLSTYKKRVGTSDRGKDYEWLLCCFYSLNFSTSPEVIDFELFTNNEFFGDFDDITLRVKFLDGSTKVFLFQLKHTEKTKTLALNSLTSTSGDFTFIKYLKSYHNILSSKNFHFILYVNRTANFKDQTKLQVESQDVYIRRHVCVGNTLLDTNKGRNCSVYRFESRDTSGFFDKFYLYANQQNDTGLKQSIGELLKNRLHCDVYTSLVEFMRSWWAGNFKLTKYDVVAKLAELVLSPMIKTLSGEDSNERTKLIEDAILKFDLILVDKIGNIWSKAKITDVKRASLTALKFGLTTKGVGKVEELSLEKKTKILWFMDEAPLVVEVDHTKKEQIDSILCFLGRCGKRRKIVLLGYCGDFPTWKTCRKLSDLKTEDLECLRQNLTVSLQGKKAITLQELDPSVFTLTQILDIAEQDIFNIGGPPETLPPCYIPRSFSKILLSCNVIDGLIKSKILLSCNNQFNTVKDKFNKGAVDITVTDRRLNFFKYNIFVTNGEFSQEVVAKELKSKHPSHHFRVSGQNLQWLTSNGKVEELEPYRRNIGVVKEHEIDDHFQSRVRIVTSHTGTGKTTLLDSLKNTAPPKCFVVKVNLKDYAKLVKNGNDVWNSVIDFSTKKLSLENDLLRSFDKTRVSVLWDNLEELNVDLLEPFLESVKSLRDLGVTQWIAAQNHFRKLLEKKLGVFAVTLLPFTQDEQTQYMQNRCGVAMSHFFENMTIVDDQEYLGVPLQLYILTDIFFKDSKLLDNIYTLTDMFAAFISGRYQHYLMRNNDDAFQQFSSFIEDAKTHRMDQYKIAAVKTHLPHLYQSLNLKNTDRFLNDIKSGDFLGLIEEVEGNRLKFQHQILGEFLTASFLAENLPQGLAECIFDEECRNIRFMFDLLVASNDPTFLAVLYKKFDGVCGKVVRDKHGRSPLHVICSYGKKHPRLETENCGDKFLIQTDKARGVQEDDEELKSIVKRLCKIYSPYDKDSLFGWNCFDYADHSLSLGLIDCLKYDVTELSNYSQVAVLYYAVRMNYSTIFNALKDFPYVEDNTGCNLVHIATEFDREAYLSRILLQKIHKVSINKLNEDNWTPLHIATFNGNFRLVKFLLNNGATFMLREPSVMSLAVVKGRKDLVEFFLEWGCSPNEFYHTNHFTTSIFQAIDRKHERIVELLLNNGGKLYCVNRKMPGDSKPNPFGMNLFHMVLENEQFEEADAVLSKGVHINSVDNIGRTAFHHAALNDHVSVVKYLLARGGDLKLMDNEKRTPLHSAAHSGSIKVAKILIEHGVNLEVQDKEGLTSLHTAVLAGKTKFVAFLIQAGANANVGNKYNRTPLHLAAIHDLIECVKILHLYGADLEAREGLYGRTPLHLAAENGNEECVKVLLDSGAILDSFCNFGYTLLHLAIQNAHLECCQLLLEAGASVAVRNRNGVTPLELMKKGYLKLGRLLLRYDPVPLHSAVARQDVIFMEELMLTKCDINGRDAEGNTPLHVAAKIRNASPLVKLLLSSGGDPTIKNRNGSVPLHVAIQSGFRDQEIVELLLHKDIVDSATIKGDTPLILACQIEWLQVVTILLEKGAKTYIRDSVGLTALHYAASSGNTDIATLLIKKNPVVDQKTNTGRTPLHLSASRGHLNVVELLLKSEACATSVDSDGDTPLDDALKAEQPDIFRLLMRYDPNYYVATTYLGRTVLHAAAKKGSLELVEFFMETIPVDDAVVEEALFNRQFRVFEYLSEKVGFNPCNLSKRYGKYPLHIVTRAGSPLVTAFLKKGAKVGVVDDEGNTPLHNAIECNNFEIFLELLRAGSDAVNIRNQKGQTVLHLARETEEIDALLNADADPDIADNEGQTPFDIFLERGMLYTQVLFKMETFDLDKKFRYYQRTLLHIAVGCKNVELIRWLKEKGASINSEDSDGDTPLHLAAKSDPEILSFLLQSYKSSLDIDKTNKEGETPLHIAAASSLPNVTKLLEFGASLDAITKYGATPLFYALRNPKCFKHLFEKTPEVKVFNMAGSMTKTMLHTAAQDGDLESVKFLLSVGLKINEADSDGYTPLKSATSENRLNVLEVLLREDTKHTIVNMYDKNGRSLLHWVAMTGNLEAVKLLVKYKAKTDLCDNRGQTASDLALENSHKKVYEFLTKKKWF